MVGWNGGGTMKPKLKDALRRLKYATNGDFPAWLQWWAVHGDPSVIKVESSAEGARVVLHWPDGRRGVCAAFGLRVVPVETMAADDFIRDYGNAVLWVWHDHHSQLVSDNRTMARRKCCEVLEAWIDGPLPDPVDEECRIGREMKMQGSTWPDITESVAASLDFNRDKWRTMRDRIINWDSQNGSLLKKETGGRPRKP
jgi:hypothetical protein